MLGSAYTASLLFRDVGNVVEVASCCFYMHNRQHPNTFLSIINILHPIFSRQNSSK